MAKPIFRTAVPSRLLQDTRRPAGSNWHIVGHVAHRQGDHNWDVIVRDWNAAVKEIVPLFEEEVISSAEQASSGDVTQPTGPITNSATHVRADTNCTNTASSAVEQDGARYRPQLEAACTSTGSQSDIGELPSLSACSGSLAQAKDDRIAETSPTEESVTEQGDLALDSSSQPERPAGFSVASQVLSGLARPWGQDAKPTQDVRAGRESTQRETEAALVQQGMSSLKAESLALHLHGTNSPYANVAALQRKMESLRQLLPGLDICSLVLRDNDVLTTDVDKAVPRLICIKTVLGEDLIQLISRNPVLLYGEDVEECLQNALKTLTRILPQGYPRESIQAALQTEPLLIFRLEHYHAVNSLEELPPDVQQLFVSSTCV